MTQGMTISEQAKAWRRRFSTSLPPSMILLWSSVSWVVTRVAWWLSEHVACAAGLWLWSRAAAAGRCAFPTTCYLTGPEAVKAISHIEAEGKMKEYNDLLAEDDDLKAPTSVRTNCIWRSGMKSPLLWKTAKSISKAPVPAACLFASSVCTPCWRKRW